jgi:hypothetical protein
MKYLFLFVILFLAFSGTIRALNYPGTEPGVTKSSISKKYAVLSNSAIRGEWQIDAGRITSLAIKNVHTRQLLTFNTGYLPGILLCNGRMIDLTTLTPSKDVQLNKNKIIAVFKDDQSGLDIEWSATLEDNSNAIIQSLKLTASKDIRVEELVFINTLVDGVRQVGEVDGSVIVCRDIFMAVEHPLAYNKVKGLNHVNCLLPRGNILKSGKSWTYTSVFGATPSGQLRRGFLYYLEKRRAKPYRPYLHYNNWYDVILARPTERATEAECLETIELYLEKLVKKRSVKMDAFVWDDGWDDFDNTLWGFHKKFPNGFKNITAVLDDYGISQGVWISPYGGFARAKDRRIEYGKRNGYEINGDAFSIAGSNYSKAFRNVCFNMIHEQGVTFFKFDRIGIKVEGSNKVEGSSKVGDSEAAETANNVDVLLELIKELQKENPNVYISTTSGTWSSPFWTLYSDNVWRGGGDHGFYGEGDTRQQWITYRDKECYEGVVQSGPLYPLNSLMLGGIIVGERRSPANIVLNEKSVADEIWSFFGTGTNLQELYVNPKLLTENMWDELASAAKWSRANSDVFVDVHWVGGDPGKAEVYGWASWRPGKGILVLRNPSSSNQDFSITPKAALELPKGSTKYMTQKTIYSNEGKTLSETLSVKNLLTISLKPFELITIELYDK